MDGHGLKDGELWVASDSHQDVCCNLKTLDTVEFWLGCQPHMSHQVQLALQDKADGMDLWGISI